MSVHKTHDSRWFCAFYPSGSGHSPKRKYFGRGKDAELAARQWDLDWKQAKRQGTPESFEDRAGDMTFLELTQRYLDQHPLKPNTQYAIVGCINNHVADLFGQEPVSKLNMSHLADLDSNLVDMGLALTTRNRYRAYCRAIGEWGFHNDLVSVNPFQKFKPDRKRENKAPDPPTDEEIQVIWEHAPEHLRWALFCLLNLGVRPGVTELFKIKISDVDFERKGVWITREKTSSPRELLPVLPEFLEEVKGLLRQDPDRAYLVEYNGHPVGSLKTAWWNTLRRAGITRRVRLYDFRHRYTSDILSQGADVKATSELLGHSSPSTTLNVYYHLQERSKRDAVNLLKVRKFS